MAQLHKNLPPEINSKWLALRQKHQEDSSDFQRAVTKSKAEFDARVELARKKLLQKHMSEESEFWNNHGRGPAVAKDPASASKSAKLQTPATAKKNIAASRTATIPVPKAANFRPPTSSTQRHLPTTPLKASQSVNAARTPQAPTKSRLRPAQKQRLHEVVDLCSSDDEDNLPFAETPIVPKYVAQSPVRDRSAIQGLAHQEPKLSEQVQSDATYPVLGATIELFGGNMAKNSFASSQSQIKDEDYQSGRPKVHDPFVSPSRPTLGEFHGLPSPVPTSSFLPSAFTEVTQSSNAFHPLTPPSIPGQGRQAGGESNPSSDLAQRVASAVPLSVHPSTFSDYAQYKKHNDPLSNDVLPSASSTTFSQRSGSIAPSSSLFTFQNLPPTQKSLPKLHMSQEDAHSNIVASEMSLRQYNYSASHKQPGALLQDPSPFVCAQQKPNKGSDNNDLRAEGSESFVRETSKDTHESNAGDAAMQIADTSLSHENASMSDTISSLSPYRRQNDNYEKSSPISNVRQSSCSLLQLRRQHLPTPPPSHASVVSEPNTPTRSSPSTTTTTYAFKKPSMPASAAPINYTCQSIGPDARHIRGGTIDSRASSFTLQAATCKQRGASLESRGSNPSACTSVTHNRKRKKSIDLSSDEDEVSDYVPSEPDSPLGKQPSRQVEDAPVLKKYKVLSGREASSKAAPQLQTAEGKNAFGFKTLSTLKLKTKPKVTPATSSSTSSKPPPFLTSKVPKKPLESPSVRASSTRPAIITKRKPAPALKKASKKKPVPQPTKRQAALHAENKIQGYFEDEQEFATGCVIEEADHMEAARLPTEMGRMSITPAPQTQDGESVAMLLDSETLTPTSSPLTPPTPITAQSCTHKSWTCDRLDGDRHVSKQSTIEGDDSEPDISEYNYVDGIIVRKGQVEELDLTGDTQIMTSGVTGGGWHGGKETWERCKGVE